MTLKQFEYLSIEDQDFILKKRAVFLYAYEATDGAHMLFQLHSFYMEVICSSKKSEYITVFVRFFEDTESLQPYLSLIDIDPVREILQTR